MTAQSHPLHWGQLAAAWLLSALGTRSAWQEVAGAAGPTLRLPVKDGCLELLLVLTQKDVVFSERHVATSLYVGQTRAFVG